MDPNSFAAACDSHFFRLKSQVDDFITSLDDLYTEPLKKLITLCFSTPDGCEIAFEGTIESVPEELSSPVNTENVENQLEQEHYAPPSAKKPKLSLHSKKCENSPHNRRVEAVASTPKPEPKIAAAPKPTRGRRKKLTARSGQSTGSTKSIQVTEPAGQDLSDNRQDELVAPHTPKPLETKTASISVAQLPASPIPQTPQEPGGVTYVVRDASSTTSPVPSQNTAIPTAPQSSVPKVTESVAKTDVGADVALSPQEEEPVAPLLSTATISKPVDDIYPKSSTFEPSHQKTKQTSLGNYPTVTSKIRPFASAERLGGASRLGLLPSSTSTRTSNKPAHQRTSQQLNESQSGNTSILDRTNGRSRSVLASKEQQLDEKRRMYESRIKLDEARMRAFQEAKAREREAQRRANEQHRLAVKLKAQQMADLQRMVTESKKQLSEERLKVDLEKQKAVESVKRKQLAPIVEQQNATVPSQPTRLLKVVPAEKSAIAPNVLKPIQLQKTGLTPASQVPSAVKRLQPTPNQPPAAPVTKAPVSNTAPKTQPPRPVALAPKPPPAPPQPTTVKQPARDPGRLPMSPQNTTFNMSLLNSDSEDEDKPYIKAPNWSRKDNLKQLPSFNAMVVGELKFPSKFISAAQIKFDLHDMFSGYEYHNRHRTSSRFWNTPVAL